MTSNGLSLQQASDADLAFCEALSRTNMAPYRAARKFAWDPQRYAASWQQFENLLILAAGEPVGVLRLCPLDSALEIRDLQLLPARMGAGIGSWAIAQAIDLARERGYSELRLRVYPENPAHGLYRRAGFRDVATIDGVVHMAIDVVRDPAPGSHCRR